MCVSLISHSCSVAIVVNTVFSTCLTLLLNSAWSILDNSKALFRLGMPISVPMSIAASKQFSCGGKMFEISAVGNCGVEVALVCSPSSSAAAAPIMLAPAPPTPPVSPPPGSVAAAAAPLLLAWVAPATPSSAAAVVVAPSLLPAPSLAPPALFPPIPPAPPTPAPPTEPI